MRARREPSSEVGDLLMRAAHAMRRQWSQSLEPWQVSPHEVRALRTVAASESRLSDIAERLRIANRSVTEVIDSLQAKGLVERTPSPTDRRAVLVRPTAAGHELLDQLADERAAAGTALTRPLTDDQVETLRELLTLMLDTDEPSPAPPPTTS